MDGGHFHLDTRGGFAALSPPAMDDVEFNEMAPTECVKLHDKVVISFKTKSIPGGMDPAAFRNRFGQECSAVGEGRCPLKKPLHGLFPWDQCPVWNPPHKGR